MVGRHLLKSWSSTQPTITLSSGEAELHGVVRAGANGLGILSLMNDLGVRLYLVLWTDSTATQGICGRQGLGKVRHLDVQDLWIQQRLRNGDFTLCKVPGEFNPGDPFTKAGLAQGRILSLLTLLGCRYVSGRALTAPLLRPRKEPAKELGLNKAKWSDAEDDTHQQYGDEELEKYIVAKGLPHWNRHNYSAQQPASAYPEVSEPKDELTEYGMSLARSNRGRSQLPWSTAPRDTDGTK